MDHDLGAEPAFTPEDVRQMMEFFATKHLGWRVDSDSLVRFFRTGKTRKPCSCGFNDGFVRSSGGLFFYPLIDESLGNIVEMPIENLLLSEKASEMRRKIGKDPE